MIVLEASEPRGVFAAALLVVGRERLVALDVGGVRCGVAQLDAGFETRSVRMASREHHGTPGTLAAVAATFAGVAPEALAEALDASYQKAATTSAKTPSTIGQLELMGTLFSLLPSSQCSRGAKRKRRALEPKTWGPHVPGQVPMRRQ
ncbi:MAG TPA: hypothetical protein VF765_31740 [Polyangiaceae bacterium]